MIKSFNYADYKYRVERGKSVAVIVLTMTGIIYH